MGTALQWQTGKEHQGLYTGQVGNVLQPSKALPTGLCNPRRCHLRAQSKIKWWLCQVITWLSPGFLYSRGGQGKAPASLEDENQERI